MDRRRSTRITSEWLYGLCIILALTSTHAEIPTTPSNCFARCLSQCIAKGGVEGECSPSCEEYRSIDRLCQGEEQPLICREVCRDIGVNHIPAHQLKQSSLRVANDNVTFDTSIAYLSLEGEDVLSPSINVIIVEVDDEGLVNGVNPSVLVIARSDMPFEYRKASPCSAVTFRAAGVTSRGIGSYMPQRITSIPLGMRVAADVSPIMINMTYDPSIKVEHDPTDAQGSVIIYFKLDAPEGRGDRPLSYSYDILSNPRSCQRQTNHAIPTPLIYRHTDGLTYSTRYSADQMDRVCDMWVLVTGVKDDLCPNMQQILFKDAKFLSIRLSCDTVGGIACDTPDAPPPLRPQSVRPFNVTATIVEGEPQFNDIPWEEWQSAINATDNLTAIVRFDRHTRSAMPVLYYIMRVGVPGERSSSRVADSPLGNHRVMSRLIGYYRTCEAEDMHFTMKVRGLTAETMDGPADARRKFITKLATETPLDTRSCYNDTFIELVDLPYGELVVQIGAVLDSRWEMMQFTGNHSLQKLLMSNTVVVNIKPPTIPTPDSTLTLVVSIVTPLLVLICMGLACTLLMAKRYKSREKMMMVDLETTRKQKYNEYVENMKPEDKLEMARYRLQIKHDCKLGSGAFGNVYLGRLAGKALAHKDSDSSLASKMMRFEDSDVAVKMLPDSADPYQKSAFLQEIELMKILGWHDNLVNILACITTSEPYCLILEYCQDGNLLHYLRARTKYMIGLEEEGIRYWEPEEEKPFDSAMILTLKQVLSFALQTSYGMEYLADQGFVHRDLAARNVLVKEKQAKVADFGLCRRIDEDSAAYTTKGGRLPLKWMALESLRSNEFTVMTDVWSYGVLLFELISFGGEPYANMNPHHVQAFLERGERMSAPEHADEDIYEVMTQCWLANPTKRPKFSEIRERLAKKLDVVTLDSYNYLDPSMDYYQPLQQETEYTAAKIMRYGGRLEGIDEERQVEGVDEDRQVEGVSHMVTVPDSEGEEEAYEEPRGRATTDTMSTTVSTEKSPSSAKTFFLPTVSRSTKSTEGSRQTAGDGEEEGSLSYANDVHVYGNDEVLCNSTTQKYVNS